MTPHIFFIYTILSFIAAGVSFLPFSKDQTGPALPDSSNKNPLYIKRRRHLFIGIFLTLLPIIAKMAFSIFPLFEARIMPVEIYAVIRREFWLPFAILFFSFASHLVPPRNRRGVLIIVGILVILVIQQTFWHLSKPKIYNYKGKIVDGVCVQTSGDTCGAASMVTLLSSMAMVSLKKKIQ